MPTGTRDFRPLVSLSSGHLNTTIGDSRAVDFLISAVPTSTLSGQFVVIGMYIDMTIAGETHRH